MPQDEEEGDARLYAHLFRGKCVYDHTEGMWYEWQGHHWERDDCKHSLLLASGPLASVYLDASAQLAEEAAQAYLRITEREWDTHPWLLACANGVLDLQSGELQSGKPDDYLKTAIPTEWAALQTPCSPLGSIPAGDLSGQARAGT